MINTDNYEFLTWQNVGEIKNSMEVFSRESVENFKKININEVYKLLTDASKIWNTIQNEEVKKWATHIFRSLIKLLKSFQMFDPDIFFNGTKSPLHFGDYCGIFKLELLIDFMNEIFIISVYCKNNGINDDSKLEQIVMKTKECARALGVFSIDPIMFENMLCNLNSPYLDTFPCEINEDPENSFQGDGISITTLPYVVRVPNFTANGTFIEYGLVPLKEGQVWINKSKYNELNSVDDDPKLS